MSISIVVLHKDTFLFIYPSSSPSCTCFTFLLFHPPPVTLSIIPFTHIKITVLHLITGSMHFIFDIIYTVSFPISLFNPPYILSSSTSSIHFFIKLQCTLGCLLIVSMNSNVLSEWCAFPKPLMVSFISTQCFFSNLTSSQCIPPPSI